MDDSFAKIQSMLAEVAEHLSTGTKAGRMAAVSRLHQIATVASTLALSIKARS